MTVAELIEELKKFDGDLEVAYYSGWNDEYNLVFGVKEDEDCSGKFVAII